MASEINSDSTINDKRNSNTGDEHREDVLDSQDYGLTLFLRELINVKDEIFGFFHVFFPFFVSPNKKRKPLDELGVLIFKEIQ